MRPVQLFCTPPGALSVCTASTALGEPRRALVAGGWHSSGQSVSQSVITKLLPVEHMVHYTHSVFSECVVESQSQGGLGALAYASPSDFLDLAEARGLRLDSQRRVDINKHKTNNGRTLHAPIRHQHSMTGTRVARCADLCKSFSNLPPPKPRLGVLAQASAQCCMHLRAPPSSRQGQGGSGGLGVGGGAGATTRPCWRRRTLRTPWRSSPS